MLSVQNFPKKIARMFSIGAYLGDFELEKLIITLKYSTDAEWI